MKDELTITEALKRTGAWGRFQYMILLVFISTCLICGMMAAHFKCLSVMPSILCLNDRCTLILSANPSEPLEKRICQMNPQDWTYDGGKTNWMTTYEMYCEKESSRDTGNSIYLTGFLFSVSICGYFADKSGRRIAGIIALAANVVTLLLIKYSTVLSEVLYLRFMLGLLHAGLFISVYVILIEFATPEQSWLCSVLGFCAANVGSGLMAYIASNSNHWGSTLDIPIFISLVCLFVFHFFIPETPHWFFAQGKELQALVALNEAAIINRSLRLQAVRIKTQITDEQEDSSFFALFKMKHYLIQTACPWFCVAFFYYVLEYSTSPNHTDGYFELILRALCGIPFYFVSFFVAQKYDFNKTAKLFLGFIALSFIMSRIPDSEIDDKITAKNVVVYLGWGAISALLGLLCVHTVRILPTFCRCFGLGICLTVATFGLALSPVVDLLGNVSYILPYVVALILGLVTMVTLDRFPDHVLIHPLPNCLAESELMLHQKNKTTAVPDCHEMESLLGDDPAFDE